MWLTNLAPDIQEAILFLPRVESGPDTPKQIARMMDLGVQRGVVVGYFANPNRQLSQLNQYPSITPR